MWDWTLFFTGLATIVIGVGLGIPFGLWLNRRTEKLQHRQEEERARQRALSLLKALQEEVRHDLDLLNQLAGELKNSKVPFYSLDTDMWEFVGGQVAEVISSDVILSPISRLYFEFDHLKRKIDALFRLYADPLMISSDVWADRYTTLSGSILAQLPPTKQLCENVLALLNDEVKRQESKSIVGWV